MMGSVFASLLLIITTIWSNLVNSFLMSFKNEFKMDQIFHVFQSNILSLKMPSTAFKEKSLEGTLVVPLFDDI